MDSSFNVPSSRNPGTVLPQNHQDPVFAQRQLHALPGQGDLQAGCYQLRNDGRQVRKLLPLRHSDVGYITGRDLNKLRAYDNKAEDLSLPDASEALKETRKRYDEERKKCVLKEKLLSRMRVLRRVTAGRTRGHPR